MLDNNLLAFTCKQLTTINRFDIKFALTHAKHRFTLDVYRQFQYRQTLVSIIKSIESADLRIKFATKDLPKFIEMATTAVEQPDWMKIIRILQVPNSEPDDNSLLTDFIRNFMNLFDILAMTKGVDISMDENQLIAAAILNDKISIPLTIPSVREICERCFNADDSIDCHNHVCINCRNQRQTRSSRRHQNESVRIDENNNNAPPTCDRCKNSSHDIELMACVHCDKSYHATSACMPVGALLLSKTHLVCPKHNKVDKIKRKSIQIPCSICFGNRWKKVDKIPKQCIDCPNKFHEKCHPNRGDSMKCPECINDRLSKNPVMLSTIKTNQFWPIVIVAEQQIPLKLKPKPLKPGLAYAFCIGQNVYRLVCTSNFLPLQLENEIARDAICPPHVYGSSMAMDIAERMTVGA